MSIDESAAETNPTIAALKRLTGTRTPGGCADCEAFQELEQVEDSGVFTLKILHDDDCPTLARRRRE